ncbi:MAG: hypothetical protein K2Y18_01455 [Alphaproteobacteria bacterium]|jgi:hypothetical protein|nr:hypothetical protein [Alphaproteobacteria bacterium]
MTDFAFLEVLRVITGGLSGEPQLGPRVTFPMEVEAKRREVVHGEFDKPFLNISSYEKDIVPIGVFPRPWVVDEKMAEGMVPELLQSTLKDAFESFKGKADGLFQENVAPIDQVLIHTGYRFYSWGSQSYESLKRSLLGDFQIAQGDFIKRLERFEYLQALRQANRWTDIGFDRLRAHVMRLEAVRAAELITKEDRIKINGTMGQFLVNSERELYFWWTRSLGLRSLYDLMHYIVDDCRVIQYQRNTGGEKSPFETQYATWSLDALYLELQAAFHTESCAQRVNLGRSSRVQEYIANTVADYFADAKDPRSFSELVAIAQRRVEEDYESLKEYVEQPALSDRERAEKFAEAVRKDHFFMAKQLALNGRLAKESYPWEEEVNFLDTYKVLLTTLFQIQNKLFIWKFKIAHRLKTQRNDSLEQLFNAIDEAEYSAFQERSRLKFVYQKEVHARINGQAGYWNQLKTSAKEKVRDYLFTGEFFDKTPCFSDAVTEVRGHIGIYTGYMRKAQSLLGEVDDRELRSSQGHLEVSPLHEEPTDSRIGLVPSVPLLTPRSSALGDFEPDRSSDIDKIDLQTYQRFYNPEEYLDLVLTALFEEDKRIGPAIINCSENCSQQDSNWDWKREKTELKRFRKILKMIDGLADVSEGYRAALKQEWIESFRKKVVTDFSAYLSQSSSWVGLKGLQDSIHLVTKSAARKVGRAIEGKSLINVVDNYRDPKFQIIFGERLRWRGSGVSPLGEKGVDQEQKIFTIDDYFSYVDSYRFETEPHIAAVIIDYQQQVEEDKPQWAWDKEREELVWYCQKWESLNGFAETEPELNKALLASFRTKVISDHSAYLSSLDVSYAQQGQIMMSKAWSSLWRKGSRVLQFQSPINNADDFRSPEFKARFEKKQGGGID